MTRLAFLCPRKAVRIACAGLRSLAVAASGVLLAAAVQAAPLGAGASVVNQAFGSYVDSVTKLNVRLSSNTVTTVTQVLEAVQLASSQSATSAPGGGFSLPHLLTNTGNSAATYVLDLVVAPGASISSMAVSLVSDVNRNGVADAGEPLLVSGSTITLAPGATTNLLVVGSIPASALMGQTAQIRLTATSTVQGATVSNVDSIAVVSGAVVAVTKSASTANPLQGDLLGFGVKAENTGTDDASGISVVINGSAGARFVLRDAVPANATFASAVTATAGAQVLYHRLGDPSTSYLTDPSLVGQGGSIDSVAWALTKLAPGASLVGSMSVMVNRNASGPLENTAYADFMGQGVRLSSASNRVVLPLPAIAPKVGFFSTNVYAVPVNQAVIGSPLFVQFEAAQCNTDPTAVLTHPITLVSKLTGDIESFTATETAANTGVFRILPSVPTENAAGRAVARGNGILEVLRDDQITASIVGCGAGSATSTLLIDPSGVVFDSKTNAPVPGATVLIVDASTNLPATVLSADGLSPSPSSVVTGNDGSYNFPFVGAGTYKLVVSPPNGFKFASVLPVGLMPAGRNVDAAGSYGATFTVAATGGPLTLDVPLDTGASSGFFIEKTASKTTAEVGDFVDYSVTLNNNTGVPLTASVVDDQLPTGFGYVKGSARLNGALLTDPAGGAGPALTFGVGGLVAGSQASITYRVRLGPGSESGTGINSASASSGLTRSNLATAKVVVGGGILSEKAYMFGKVYADCNANRIQDVDEPGIPGVRIFLDNGTFAVTDIEGKYSLYGLTPRTYVAKIDSTSLPEDVTLEVLANRNAEDSASRFVDLKRGEMHKADFAIEQCSRTVRDEIAARRAALGTNATELTDVVTNQIRVNPVVVADARSLPASGIVGHPASEPTRTVGAEPLGPPTDSVRDGPSELDRVNGVHNSSSSAAGKARSPGVADPRTALEALLRTLTPEPGFIDLVDAQVMPADQARVRVKGPMGQTLRLLVNGVEISAKQVGEKSCLESTATCALDFIGIDLKPGKNRLAVEAVDDFSIVRGRAVVTVVAPGSLAKVTISAPAEAVADGRTAVEVVVRLFDKDDVPVTSRYALTLESSAGEWQTPDLDPKEQGTQVFVDGGIGRFMLLSPAASVKARIRIGTSGAAIGSALRARAEVVFMPELRPMIAAGIVEGAINLRNLNPKSVVASGSTDTFEREIQTSSQSFDNGKGSAAARASLFLKGKVLGSDLLTLAYDSDKPADTALFRDIQPDQFYPVYGDSSVKGYDARSTGKLYARIDHGTSYAMYGDFSTQTDNPARVLSQYTRALNGARVHVEDGSFTADAFASSTDSTQVIDEIVANGTSGPFQLSQRGVINSQRVDIITRDRNQPSLVLKDVPMSALADYAIEPLSGQLLFKAPIPSLDSNLNPIYIRVTYEVSTGGQSYWVGGIDARQAIAVGFVLGGTLVRDTNPLNRSSLYGANALWTIGPNTALTAEYAKTESDLMETGDARRLELKHSDNRLQARVYAVQTTPEFNNPNSTFTAGASEFGAKGGYVLDDKNRVVFEAVRTTTAGATVITPASIFVVGTQTPLAGGARREGEMVGLEHSLPYDAKATISVRHVDASDVATQPQGLAAGAARYTSLRARLDVPVPEVPTATVFGQYEQAVADSGQRAVTLGGNYQLTPKTRLYATHELTNSLTGDYGLSAGQQNYSTVAGLDTAYMKDGQMFDEYRVSDGLDGRSAQAAIGLRNQWEIAKGLSLNTTLQQIRPLSGSESNKSVALTGAMAYTASSKWKGSTRLEWSRSAVSTTWLATVGAAAKLSPEMTLLGRGLYNQQTVASAGTAGVTAGPGGIRLSKLQLGIAYRPVDSNVWNALARVEHNHLQNSTAGSAGASIGVDEASDVFSAHFNYQPTASWTLNGRYGVKRATDRSNGFASSYTAQVLGGRAIWDIDSKWDIGVQHYVEFGGTGGVLGAGARIARQQAIGVEAGYLVVKNLWLSAGYNVKGFRDADLVGEDYTQGGVYMRLRFKFDENLFKPSNNSQPLPAAPGQDR